MKTVLVVDDFASVRFYHESVLSHAGYKTAAATDGIDALSVLERTPVQLIMLDLVMPRMTGREFLRQVRARHQDIPVLLITSDADKDEAPTEGVSATLKKPVLPEQLVAAVTRIIGRSQPRSGETVT
jgi:CheY-like chemotaxis protein